MTIAVRDIVGFASNGMFKISGSTPPANTTNILTVSPATIMSYYIIDNLSKMTYPSDDGDWPLYVASLPDSHYVDSNCGAVYDRVGAKDGRNMADGKLYQRFGIQLKIRSIDHSTGYNKIENIASQLDGTRNQTITKGTDNFYLYSVTRNSPVIPLGVEKGTKRRFIFVSNFNVIIKKIEV